ncbi:MAG: hypothetical protein ABMA13_09240 [Chthoniobacteraceae bacterium]
MARIFLILSIVLALGAAFLGYKSTEQAKALQTDLSNTRADLAKTKAELKKTQGELEDTKKELADTQDRLKKTEDELTSTKGMLDTAKADLVKAQTEAADATTKLAGVQGELDKIKEQFKGIEPDKLVASIKDLNDSKAKLETELAEAKQVQATLQQKKDEAEAQFATKDRTIAEYKSGYVRNGLTGKVLAYNPGWNFVVVNLGDKAGLKSGVQMVVTRSGAMIGKVKVTTVEPSTAIADVLPGSLARGESVQPGDTVIYQGAR